MNMSTVQAPDERTFLPMNTAHSHARLVRKLENALGETVCAALMEANVVEIMLNPDGRVFVERLGEPPQHIGDLNGGASEIVIGAVAHTLGTDAHGNQPIVSGELPMDGHRFEGLLPPIVSAPAFTIRKRASRLIPLSDYCEAGILTAKHADAIREAIASRLNIVVAGGTGSGKTTLANALLHEIATIAPQQRLIILEDTAELQCAAVNAVALRTSSTVDMGRLLKSTMRLRPDRIIIGEVRDGAALTLLKGWNTGHPGGLTTIHANDAPSALRRLEQLTAEASQQPMCEVIGEAIDLVVSIERTPVGRVVRDVLRVEAFSSGKYRLNRIEG